MIMKTKEKIFNKNEQNKKLLKNILSKSEE